MKKLFIVFLVFFLSGCATVKYNGGDRVVKEISVPSIGQTNKVFVGDSLLRKGKLVKVGVLDVLEAYDGFGYVIPAKRYIQLGFDERRDYYSAIGVVNSILADPPKALSLGKKPGDGLCVVTVYGGLSCVSVKYERNQVISERGNSFQQTLIYSGRVGNKINISYREFSNDLARPAFNNDVEYDLSASRLVGYKGAQIEVIEADNSGITYRVIRNFP